MGRIEDALAKLKYEKKAPASWSSGEVGGDSRATSGKVRHEYGGVPIEIDLDRLRAIGLCAPEDQEALLAEQYRVIKRPLLAAASADSSMLPLGNLVMISSAVDNEGKTFTSFNLSRSVAREKDWTVVLVDADCHRARLTHLLGLEKERGLLDVLREPWPEFESLVVPTNLPGFSVLPRGGHDEQAAELMGSARMDSLFEWLAASDPRRLIVFDSAPLLMASEAPVLASKVGQVVVVVKANTTPQKVVLDACDRLDRNKANSLLLNCSSKNDHSGTYGMYFRAPDAVAS